MIVTLSDLAIEQRNEIGYYLWKSIPCGNDEEDAYVWGLVQAEWANIDKAVAQLRQFPESGPALAGKQRKLKIPNSRYTMTYQFSEDGKQIDVLDIIGAQKRGNRLRPR